MVIYQANKMLKDGNNHKLKIKVLGIGHAGCRIIEHLICDGFDPQSCIFVFTQEKEFTKCGWPNRIYLWERYELIEDSKRPTGERHFHIPHAVNSCEPLISQMLSGADLTLIAAGMDSAEEMVAAPCLADVCHTTGTMVISVCSLLSLSENRTHSKTALESVEKMRSYSDLTVLISKDCVKKLFKEQKAYSSRDSLFHFEMARSAVQTLADFFSEVYLTLGSFIQGDLRQIALPNTVGRMGFGFGDTLAEAAQNALSCPLIEPGKFHREISFAIAKLKVTGDMTVTEVSEALDILEGMKGRAYPLLVSMEKSDIFASEAILFRWELSEVNIHTAILLQCS
jgi:cell division GTPase FtsZ